MPCAMTRAIARPESPSLSRPSSSAWPARCASGGRSLLKAARGEGQGRASRPPCWRRMSGLSGMSARNPPSLCTMRRPRPTRRLRLTLAGGTGDGSAAADRTRVWCGCAPLRCAGEPPPTDCREPAAQGRHPRRGWTPWRGTRPAPPSPPRRDGDAYAGSRHSTRSDRGGCVAPNRPSLRDHAAGRVCRGCPWLPIGCRSAGSGRGRAAALRHLLPAPKLDQPTPSVRRQVARHRRPPPTHPGRARRFGEALGHGRPRPRAYLHLRR